MNDIIGRVPSALESVRARMAAAERRFRRPLGAVELVAVSKTRGPEAIRAAYGCGQRAFGESYVQEALKKISALTDLDLEWHFIGPLQANKTRAVAEHFSWVHSVDRLKIARRLSAQRPPGLPPLQICIEVNVSGEQSKAGVSLAELPALALAVNALPGLRLRGLMSVPAPAEDFAAQRAPFRLVRQALEALRERGLALDTLSMGMTADLEAAIAEGATLVRVGTAVFGPRSGNAGQ